MERDRIPARSGVSVKAIVPLLGTGAVRAGRSMWIDHYEERDRPFRERRRHGSIMAHTSTRGFCGCLALRAALTQEV